MNRGKVLKGLAIALVVLALVAVVGGGIVLATTSAFGSDEAADTAAGKASEVAQVTEDESEPGVVVASVDPDGPAAAAGVVRGDILLSINDEPVNDIVELQGRLADLGVGDQVQLTVLHGDAERTLTATLDEQNGKPYLGVVPCGGFPKLRGLLGELSSGEGLPFASGTSGAMIVRVVPDSPADAAGLKEGDRIVTVDGQELDAENDLADLIQARNPGDTVTLEVERAEGESLELTAELGEQPENEGVAYLGVEYRPSPQIRRFMGEGLPLDELPFDEMPFRGQSSAITIGGGLILKVDEGSPAAEAGLQAGDRITKIDGAEVSPENNLPDSIADHQPGDTVTLEVERPGETEPFEVTIQLGENPEQEGAAYLGVRALPFGGLGPFGGRFGLDKLPFGDEDFAVPPNGETRQGAIVREVTENGPADQAGLGEGDVITAIDGEPVEGPQALTDAVGEYAPGDEVTLTVYSPDDEVEREVKVMLAENPDEEGKAYLGVRIGGFFRLWRSEESEGGPSGMRPFGGFLEGFPGGRFSDWDQFPFNFDFKLPPELFDKEPLQSEQSTL